MTLRHHLATTLRVLASLALVVCSLTLWSEPLRLLLEPRMTPIAEQLGVTTLLQHPARGFMLQITSIPSGAAFVVQGEERGHTPAMANVLCRNGETVAINVRKEGFAPYQRQVECREGGRLQVRARLER